MFLITTLLKIGVILNMFTGQLFSMKSACKRYAQLVGENALKEAAENKFHIWQRVLNESHFPVIDTDEDPVKYPTMIGHDDGRGGHHMEYLTREEIIEAWRTEDGFVTWLKPIDKSSITNPKNVKLL